LVCRIRRFGFATRVLAVALPSARPSIAKAISVPIARIKTLPATAEYTFASIVAVTLSQVTQFAEPSRVHTDRMKFKRRGSATTGKWIVVRKCNSETAKIQAAKVPSRKTSDSVVVFV
jgi:hypothetical protein